jgi:hypothetical protein
MMIYLEDHPKTDHQFRSVFGQINPVSAKMLWGVQHLLYTNVQKEVRKRMPNIDMFIPSPNENGISSKNHGWTWCPFHTGWLINHINPVPTTFIPTPQHSYQLCKPLVQYCVDSFYLGSSKLCFECDQGLRIIIPYPFASFCYIPTGM